jgi:hypothetical protein
LVDLAQILQGQILRVTFYAFSFLIVSNTYKLRAIVGWIKLHFFPQIFTMADFHAKITKKIAHFFTLGDLFKVK